MKTGEQDTEKTKKFKSFKSFFLYDENYSDGAVYQTPQGFQLPESVEATKYGRGYACSLENIVVKITDEELRKDRKAYTVNGNSCTTKHVIACIADIGVLSKTLLEVSLPAELVLIKEEGSHNWQTTLNVRLMTYDATEIPWPKPKKQWSK